MQVHISLHTEHMLPCGVGVASDPMAIRRGGKQLPMEDMCYYQCPLPGVEQVSAKLIDMLLLRFHSNQILECSLGSLAYSTGMVEQQQLKLLAS